jgi:SAM-dependent methyltransferase
MARTVSYARQTLDSPNPLARFAHRSRYKVSLDLADRLLPQHGALVDFGAGEGTFLDKFQARRADAQLTAIEPHMTIAFPNIARVPSIWEIPEGTVDLVAAFEVLEHVTDEGLADFLAGARKALKPGGRLLVTVPIMYGVAVPVKEASRAILHRRLGDTGPVEMLKAMMGVPIPRAANRLTSHKGFDFRQLRKEIAGTFTIIEETRSPFPKAPWWLNSQAIFISE